MAVFLVPIEKGRPIVLDKAIVLIGRQADCDVVITRSRRVSRRHCCVAQVNDHFVVRDLGSMNGVRVNGKRIDLESDLRFGDVVSIGDVGYILQSRDVSTSRRDRDAGPEEDFETGPERPLPLVKQPLDLSQMHPVAIPRGFQPADPDSRESFGEEEEADSESLRSSGTAAASLEKVQSADFVSPAHKAPRPAPVETGRSKNAGSPDDMDFAELPIPSRPVLPRNAAADEDDEDDDASAPRGRNQGLSSHYELLPD